MSSAGPASGKYGGFGNKDVDQYGYNASKPQGYDPYVNKLGSSSASTQPPTSTTSKKEEYKPSQKKKRRADSSESSSSGENSSGDSSDSEDEKKKKKKKKQSLGMPNKSERTIQGGNQPS
jgi:hypothetical protein